MIAGATQIGPEFSGLISTRHVLVGVKPINNYSSFEYWRYEGEPNAWTKIADVGFFNVVATEEDLFGWKSDGTIWRFTGEPLNWAQIGSGAMRIDGGQHGLISQNRTTKVLSSFDPSNGQWTEFGGVQPDWALFFTTDGQHVIRNMGDTLGMTWLERWNPKTGTWINMGWDLVICKFFDGYLIAWKFDGGSTGQAKTFNSIQRLNPGGTWTTLTTEQLYGGTAVMRNGRMLIMTITGKLMTCANPRADNPVWTEIATDDSHLHMIAATERRAFVTSTAGTFQIPNPLTDERRLQTRTPGKTRWLVAAKTADKMFAGYSGNMNYTLTVDGTLVAGQFPVYSFDRGATVWFEIEVPSTLKTLQRVVLWGDMGYFADDTWTLSHLSFRNPDNRTNFDYDGEVAIGDGAGFSTDLGAPQNTFADRSYTSGQVRVHVWQWRTWPFNMNNAVGHVSVEIVDDGTYISWWPEAAKDAASFMSKINFPSSKPYTAVQPRSFADDVKAEDGLQPNYSFVVGGLDTAAIKTWWNAFRTNPANKYILLQENCSSVSYKALKAGGALTRLTDEQRIFYDTPSWPWTPWFMWLFLERINSQQVGTSGDPHTELRNPDSPSTG